MGRFAHASHVELRPYYRHCLDYTALRNRLVDDPPDPYDDHPSMAAAPQVAPPAAAVVSGTEVGEEGDRDAPSPLLLLLGAGAEDGQSLSLNMEGARGEGITFAAPATRAFAYELRREVHQLWLFLEQEYRSCAVELEGLQDEAARLRHALKGRVAATSSTQQEERGRDRGHFLPKGAGIELMERGGRTASNASDAEQQQQQQQTGAGGLGEDQQPGVFHALASPSRRGEAGQGQNKGLRSRSIESGSSSSSSSSGSGSGVGTWGARASSSEKEKFTTAGAAAMGVSAANGRVTAVTPDPHEHARLKIATVKLYDHCHRLLTFKMVNYEACARLIQAHVRTVHSDDDDDTVGGAGRKRGGGSSRSGPKNEYGEIPTSVASPTRASTSTAATAALLCEKDLLMFLHSLPCFSSSALSQTMGGVELLYAGLFCNGDVDVARASLMFKASTGATSSMRTFHFGYQLGAAAVLLAWVLWDCLADDSMGKSVWHDPAFKIYRGLGNLVLLVWCWGAQIWVWRRFGVDYLRCLGLEPAPPRVSPVEEVWRTGCDLSIAWLVSYIAFYKALRGVLIDPRLMPTQFAHTFPLLLLLYMMHRFLTPWKRKRRNLMLLIWQTVISPFGPVHFVHGYVGDVLTSLVRVLIDLAFAFVFFLSGVRGWLNNSDPADVLGKDHIGNQPAFSHGLVPLLTALPLWWRFQQNMRRSFETGERWPHLGNALKYAVAMSVSLFGAFQPGLHNSPLWILSFVAATLYQYCWDIFMDWDLLRFDAGAGGGGGAGRARCWGVRLRHRLLYKRHAVYVSIAVLNFILRFFWTVSIIPENYAVNRGGGGGGGGGGAGGADSDGGNNKSSYLFTKDFQIYLSPVIAAAEIIRRSLWGILRLENEHLRLYKTASAYSPLSGGGTGGSSSSSNNSSTSSSSSSSSSSSLDGVAFSRMELNTSSGGGGGGGRGGANFVVEWCLQRTPAGASRRKLMAELMVFSVALVVVAFVARATAAANDT